MQTALADSLKDTATGREAEAILRACVHCGFCNANCPTYRLLGDELDGPRGRIYQIKQALEGAPVSSKTQLHLDRCLTCLACETTCPSGVQYGRLLEIGRATVAARVPRGPWARLVRRALRAVIPHPHRFGAILAIGQKLRPLMPARLRRHVPAPQTAGAWPTRRHARTMLVLDGCVQPSLAPRINAATARVLDALGIRLVRAHRSGCCGALSAHLNALDEARAFARRNIDAWWPDIERGAEAIVITASGCGTQVKDYGHLLQDDRAYKDKAARVAALAADISEVLAREPLDTLPQRAHAAPVAFHAPCSLQHGQRLAGVVETLLRARGVVLTHVADAHLCCGSAGTYSLLQPALAQSLLKNKLAALEHGAPATIVTANIGCLSHLQTRARVPVRHWIELLDPLEE